ncbi:unnamed protein product [Amoebophrya sp. A120]|nr:unnamed protein product [Amoebophrya sp. A120]|eukprot:GSA120T00015548001.1
MPLRCVMNRNTSSKHRTSKKRRIRKKEKKDRYFMVSGRYKPLVSTGLHLEAAPRPPARLLTTVFLCAGHEPQTSFCWTRFTSSFSASLRSQWIGTAIIYSFLFPDLFFLLMCSLVRGRTMKVAGVTAGAGPHPRVTALLLLRVPQHGFQRSRVSPRVYAE